MQSIHPFSCTCGCSNVVIPGRMDIFAAYGGYTPSSGTVFSRCASVATAAQPTNGRALEPLWGYVREEIRSLWQSVASWDGQTVWCQEQYNPCLYDEFGATAGTVSLTTHTTVALDAPSAFFPDGVGWVQHTGSFIVSGGSLARQVGGGQPRAIASTNFTNSDFEIVVGIAAGTSGWIACVFRYVNPDNYLRLRFDRPNDTVYLESVSSGVVTVLDSVVDSVLALGATAVITCEGDEIKFEQQIGFDRTVMLSATTSAHNTAKRIGFESPAGSTSGTVNYIITRILSKDIKHCHVVYSGDQKVAEIVDDFFEDKLIAGSGSKVLVSAGGLAPQSSTGVQIFKEISTGGSVTNINYDHSASESDWTLKYVARPKSERRGYPTVIGERITDIGTPVWNETFSYWQTNVTAILVIGEMDWGGLPAVGSESTIHTITRYVRHTFVEGYHDENPPTELEVRTRAATTGVCYRLPDPLDDDFAGFDYDNTVPSYDQMTLLSAYPDGNTGVITYSQSGSGLGSITYSILYIDGAEILFKEGSYATSYGGPTFTDGKILAAYFAPGKCACIHQAHNGTYTFKIFNSGGEVYSSDADGALIYVGAGIMAASHNFFYVKGISGGTFNTTNGPDSQLWLVSHDGTIRAPINQTSCYSLGGYLVWPGLGFDPRPFQLGGHLFTGYNLDVVKSQLPYSPLTENPNYL